jgi:uncharacterized protein YggT (Ycf19 family)
MAKRLKLKAPTITHKQRFLNIMTNARYILKYGSIIDASIVQLYLMQLNLLELLALIVRFYRLLLQTRMLFEQLPLFNPYYWPLSLLFSITDGFVEFCERLMPRVKLCGITFDVSVLMGLELISLVLDILGQGCDITLHRLALKVNSINKKKKLLLFARYVYSSVAEE